MNKEHIIIDGVNVSRCKFFNDITESYYCFGIPCKDHPNCYFKQLARKTQECEELKKQLMQKDEINTFFNTPIEGWSSNPCDICENKNNYEQLKQECEELKEELAIYKKMLDDPEFKIALTDVRTGEREVWRKLGSKTDRYRKALEEIKGIIDNRILDTRINSAYVIHDHYLARFQEILDIINKAEGDNNENT